MSRQYDVLRYIARQVHHHIVRLAGILRLLDADLGSSRAGIHQMHRVLGVDVDAQDLVTLADIAAKLPLVNIAVGIIAISVIGNKANSAVFQ